MIRLRDGQDDSDRAEQSTADGNVGSIVTPSSVKLQFLGNARSKVTAAPQFIRIATGDAKAVTNGLKNAHSQWTCSGFENRAFTDKYPLCPEGSQVERVLNFPAAGTARTPTAPTTATTSPSRTSGRAPARRASRPSRSCG